MTVETPKHIRVERGRLAARQWVAAFNARDDEREADARTAPPRPKACKDPWSPALARSYRPLLTA
jgi:hypothetical protein